MIAILGLLGIVRLLCADRVISESREWKLFFRAVSLIWDISACSVSFQRFPESRAFFIEVGHFYADSVRV